MNLKWGLNVSLLSSKTPRHIALLLFLSPHMVFQQRTFDLTTSPTLPFPLSNSKHNAKLNPSTKSDITWIFRQVATIVTWIWIYHTKYLDVLLYGISLVFDISCAHLLVLKLKPNCCRCWNGQFTKPEWFFSKAARYNQNFGESW